MRFRYSSDVDILMVFMSQEPIRYGEDNEGVIVHHKEDGTPVALEILDASQFVMFANASVVSGQEITNPNVRQVRYSGEPDAPARAVPKGDADLRFKHLPDRDTLIVRFGDGNFDSIRNSQGMLVYYGKNELPTGLEIANARQFVLGSIKSVLLKEEVRVA
jgi:uncharacterized protein YuzE